MFCVFHLEHISTNNTAISLQVSAIFCKQLIGHICVLSICRKKISVNTVSNKMIDQKHLIIFKNILRDQIHCTFPVTHFPLFFK